MQKKPLDHTIRELIDHEDNGIKRTAVSLQKQLEKKAKQDEPDPNQPPLPFNK